MPIPLDENLRNTKQIAGTFSSLAPSQMRIRGRQRRARPLRASARPRTPSSVADDEAVALLDERLAPGAVALLTTGQPPPRAGRASAGGQDVYWASFWDDDDLFYGHVLGFKGLERPPSSWPSTASATRPAPGRCSTSACPVPATCSSSAATWT